MNPALPALAIVLMLGLPGVSASGQSVQYPFTAGSMSPVVSGLPPGVTASNFSIGTYSFASLSDNGGSGNSLRLSRGDVGTSSTTALSGPCLSFSLTIPAGVSIHLTSLSLEFSSAGITGAEYINARVFSSIDGYDSVTADTVGTVGRVANGADSGTSAISLATPDSNPTNGANANNGDFDNLSNQTVTFYLPFIRDSQTTATDYVDIDNVTLHLTVASSPGVVANFTAAVVSPFETALSWEESASNETGFIIERNVTGSGVWETIITTGPGVTSIRDCTTAPGSTCSYRVSALLPEGGTSPAALSNSVSIPAAANTPPVVMPMGDSITQGAGAGGGYRSPLYQSLTNSNFPIQYIGSRTDAPTTLLTNAGQTHHEGHGSYSTDLLLGNLDANKPYGGTDEGGYWITGGGGTGRAAVYPDLILLMIGTNDIGMWAHTPAEAIAYYDQLLTKLVTLRPSARIICASIVPFVLSSFENAYPDKIGVYTNREANNVIYNGLLPGLVATHQNAGHRVQFYDMRQKVNPANAATLIGGDGVHPNQAGYNAIASGWVDAIKQLPILASWRMLHFGSANATGSAADAADPDADGHSNLMEYALGTSPTTPSSRPATLSSVSHAGSNHLAISFPRRKHPDLRYLVEVSSDLQSWSADAVQTGLPSSLNSDFEQVTFRDQQPAGPGGKRFIRLRVVKP